MVLFVFIETHCSMVINQTNIEVTLSMLLMSNFQMIPNFCFQLEAKTKLLFNGERSKIENIYNIFKVKKLNPSQF